jgi:hypothetical protein
VIRDPIDLRAFLDSEISEYVASFEVRAAPGDELYFASTYRYSVEQRELPRFDARLPLRDLIGFGAEPSHMHAASHPQLMTLETEPVLFAHAPSEIAFDVPPNARALTGAYGVMPGAFELNPQLRALTFRVIDMTGGKERTLFEHDLSASGRREFQVELPAEGVARLELRASCSPTCEGGWTYWSRVAFVDRAPQ